MEPRTERNARRLREASERLLSGRPRVSDGNLTLKSLAEEAGVPRQYLYRDAYREIASEFETDARKLVERSGAPNAHLHEIDRLRSRLSEIRKLASRYRKEREDVRRDLRVAASKIAFLLDQNAVLRSELEAAQRVIRLEERRSS